MHVQEMKLACAQCVEDLGLLNLLVRLLDSTQQCLSVAKGASVPKYVLEFVRFCFWCSCSFGASVSVTTVQSAAVLMACSVTITASKMTCIVSGGS